MSSKKRSYDEMVALGAFQPLPEIPNCPDIDINPYPALPDALLGFHDLSVGNVTDDWQPLPEEMCLSGPETGSQPFTTNQAVEGGLFQNELVYHNQAKPPRPRSPEAPGRLAIPTSAVTLTTEPNMPVETPSRRKHRDKRPRRKKDEPEPDYSAIIRDQVKNATRTGQACDRCKVSASLPSYIYSIRPQANYSQVKRMKCDARPECCTNCLLHKKKCNVTDLTTGITTTRGEVQHVKEELLRSRSTIKSLRNEISNLNGEIEHLRSYIKDVTDVENTKVRRSRFGQGAARDYATRPARVSVPATVSAPSTPYPSRGLRHDGHVSNANIQQALPYNYPPALLDLSRYDPVSAPLEAAQGSSEAETKGLPDYGQQLNEFEKLWAQVDPG